MYGQTVGARPGRIAPGWGLWARGGGGSHPGRRRALVPKEPAARPTALPLRGLPLRGVARPTAPTYRRRRGDPGRASAPPSLIQHGRLLRTGSHHASASGTWPALMTLDLPRPRFPQSLGAGRVGTTDDFLEEVAAGITLNLWEPVQECEGQRLLEAYGQSQRVSGCFIWALVNSPSHSP